MTPDQQHTSLPHAFGFTLLAWPDVFQDTAESAAEYHRLCEQMRQMVIWHVEREDLAVESVALEVMGQQPPRERHALSIGMDLSGVAVRAAIAQLSDLQDAPVSLVVHPSEQFPAKEAIANNSGYPQIRVRGDYRLGRDAWCLRGVKHEIYSEGA